MERILQHSHIPSEAPLVIEESRPNSDWPVKGTIDLFDLQVNTIIQVVENYFLLYLWLIIYYSHYYARMIEGIILSSALCFTYSTCFESPYMHFSRRNDGGIYGAYR